MYSSLLYKLLFAEGGYDQVIRLAEEYKKIGSLTDEMLVNLACAYGQKVKNLRSGGDSGNAGEIAAATAKALESFALL